MVSLVNSHTNATSKRRHLWEIDLRFALNSTPGWGEIDFCGWIEVVRYRWLLVRQGLTLHPVRECIDYTTSMITDEKTLRGLLFS